MQGGQIFASSFAPGARGSHRDLPLLCRCNATCGIHDTCWNGSFPTSSTCSSCSASSGSQSTDVCCDWCCPHNFTELYFQEHPEAYRYHPPALLYQLSTYDVNADLCAAKNYAATLQANGVEAVLVLESVEQERCYCVGQESDPSAAGSPFLGECTATVPDPKLSPVFCMYGHYSGHQKQLCCLGHTMGFASMVDPLVRFVVRLAA